VALTIDIQQDFIKSVWSNMDIELSYLYRDDIVQKMQCKECATNMEDKAAFCELGKAAANRFHGIGLGFGSSPSFCKYHSILRGVWGLVDKWETRLKALEYNYQQKGTHMLLNP
jgi:hypothetical protein